MSNLYVSLSPVQSYITFFQNFRIYYRSVDPFVETHFLECVPSRAATLLTSLTVTFPCRAASMAAATPCATFALSSLGSQASLPRSLPLLAGCWILTLNLPIWINSFVSVSLPTHLRSRPRVTRVSLLGLAAEGHCRKALSGAIRPTTNAAPRRARPARLPHNPFISS